MFADYNPGDFSGWSNGWEAITSADSAEYWTRELAREISENASHVLFGKQVRFIAVNRESDNFIAVIESAKQFVYIHLTFHQETNPKFPCTEILGDEAGLKKFVAAWSS